MGSHRDTHTHINTCTCSTKPTLPRERNILKSFESLFLELVYQVIKEYKREGPWKSLKHILKPASDSCKRSNPRHHPQLSYSCMSWKPSILKPGWSRRLRGLFTLTSLSNFHNFCCLEDWPLTLFLYQDSELLSLQLKQLQRDIWNAGSFELLLIEILRSSVSFDLLSHRAQSSLPFLSPSLSLSLSKHGCSQRLCV